MSKWEYLSFNFSPDQLNEFHEQINQLGEQGWEMVGMTSIESKSIGLFDSGAATSGIIVVFKRPKE